MGGAVVGGAAAVVDELERVALATCLSACVAVRCIVVVWRG